MKTKYPFLDLASQSSRRKKILRQLGVRFKVVPSDYRERSIPGMSPRQLVLTHAEGKARLAKRSGRGRYVLAADTIVVLRGKILGKPRNRQEAVRMLRRIQGKSHMVYTGVVVWEPASGFLKKGCVATRVWIKKMAPKIIDQYLRTVYPLDKAGSYGIQEGPKIVTKIKGSYTNVVGLPVELLKVWFETLDRNRSRRDGARVVPTIADNRKT